MARHPRYSLPGQPQHVIQRGNNRTPTFLDTDDFQFFYRCLQQALSRFECELHAYVLMNNHTHFLVTPLVAGAISKVMQSVGRKYVAWFNNRYQRTGSLWEGRFRATVIDTEEYLFACYRYIELNPVRAGMVAEPGLYRWSSFPFNALGVPDAIVTPHVRYAALGTVPRIRQAAYRALFSTEVDPSAVAQIRAATNKGWALGNERFRQRVSRVDRRAYPLVRWADMPGSSAGTH